MYAVIAAEIADGEKRTFLETHAVQRKTRAKYKAVLEQCRRWLRQKGYRMVRDVQIDAGLCQFMNFNFFSAAFKPLSGKPSLALS